MTGHLAGDASGEGAATIGELVTIFRESLTSLVPSMERVRIPWREGEAYDEWDAIAEALFAAIVGSSVEHLMVGYQPLARYGFLLPANDRFSLICASSKVEPSRRGALVCFATAVRPFDLAHVQRLSADGAHEPETIDIPVDEARFSLLLRDGGKVEEVTEVQLPD